MRALTGLVTATIFMALTGCSQTNKIAKGYAYAREVLSGVKPKVSVAENGDIIQKSSSPGIQYFIYVTTKDTTSLQLNGIWIKGQKYIAEVETITSLPAMIPIEGSYGNPDTLLDTSGFHPWKINVGHVMPADSNDSVPGKLKGNEVVISFLLKGKLRYFRIAKIIYLEPLTLQ